MARTPVAASTYYAKANSVADQLVAWTTPKTKAPKVKRAACWVREVARTELDGFIKAKDWEDALPRHFVELYCKMHLLVYGVEALELRPAKMALACASLAKRCMVTNFDNDPNQLADFMRWVWRKQEAEEKKRAVAESASDFRISWRYQWAPGLVTQYNRYLLTQKKERQ